jgi:hypothetical protein
MGCLSSALLFTTSCKDGSHSANDLAFEDVIADLDAELLERAA